MPSHKQAFARITFSHLVPHPQRKVREYACRSLACTGTSARFCVMTYIISYFFLFSVPDASTCRRTRVTRAIPCRANIRDVVVSQRDVIFVPSETEPSGIEFGNCQSIAVSKRAERKRFMGIVYIDITLFRSIFISVKAVWRRMFFSLAMTDLV